MVVMQRRYGIGVGSRDRYLFVVLVVIVFCSRFPVGRAIEPYKSYLNNSVGFIPKLRIQISSVLNAKLTNYFSRQPCVALCADKVTVAKRTMDITAIIALVPEAPKQEMVQAFVIGAPVVKDHSGDGELKNTRGKHTLNILVENIQYTYSWKTYNKHTRGKVWQAAR